MPNTFVTADKVARDASILLRENLVAGNLVNRNVVEPMLDGNSGGAVRVSYTPVTVAKQQDHTNGPQALSDSDIAEAFVTVPAKEYFFIRKKLNNIEKTYQLDDFNTKVTLPSMVGLAEAIDQYLIDRLLLGFGRTIAGVEGNEPADKADIVAARKVLQDNKCPMNRVVGVIGTSVEANFLQLNEFSSVDFGSILNDAVTNAALKRRYGIDWFTTQNAGQTHVRGDQSGTVLTDGVTAAGATSVPMNGFTAATGTVNKYTRLTLAGSSLVYTLTADMTLASNAGVAKIHPALDAQIANDAAVTFPSGHRKNLLFNPAGTAAAIIAPSPLMNDSAVRPFEGLSIRVSMESTTSDSSVGAADFILFDCYVGCTVVRHECGLLFAG